ncbi:MAG: FkbM family methyltransferase [Desulfobacteraceae bacterium]|nr:FkbM family methyltransferase [Desulfobacteraceae bacterium]
MTEMNLNSTRHHDTISDIDPTVRVFHVGGRGDMGPVECLLQIGDGLSLSIFEANIETGDSSWDDYDRLVTDYANRYGVKLTIIPRCLSNCVGKKEFHINVMPDCSSLLKMSPNAKNYTRMDRGKYRIIWGQICQPTSNIEIDVTTLDELCANRVIQVPHFLSLDVQGAEYDILEGASKALQGDLLGVVSEVEFRELYEGQKLFMDQYALLKKHQFSLFDLYNTEYWYSGPILGKGALMVAEALFLRDYEYFIRKDNENGCLLSNLSKLAIVAYYFDRRSYAFEIMEYIMNNRQPEWNIFVKQSDRKYLHELTEFYQEVKALRPQLEKIPTYLEFMATGPNTSSRPKSMPRLKDVLSLAYNLNLKMILNKLRR